MALVLLCGGNDAGRRRLLGSLTQQGVRVSALADCAGAAASAQGASPDLILLHASESDPWDAVRTAERFRQRGNTVPILVIATRSSEAQAVAALRARVIDYFRRPISEAEVTASVLRNLVGPPSEPVVTARPPCVEPPLVGGSAKMEEVKVRLSRLASADCNVLITGETGTGKELAALMIHQGSVRRGRPMVSINCAAIPDSLLESELFGYERGAFTGAGRAMTGKLLHADGGTVFLDEIGDMSPCSQAKLLRAIETKEVQPLGGGKRHWLNVRIIAATNRDLDQAVASQAFRKDLYFRLNVGRVHLPPLRERSEDIPELLDFYLHVLNKASQRRAEGFTDEAMACLLRYDWPGNVRELKNSVEAALVALSSPMIGAAELPEALRQSDGRAATGASSERDRLLCALQATAWNKSKTARELNWSRMTVYRKMAAYHLSPSVSLSSPSPVGTPLSPHRSDVTTL